MYPLYYLLETVKLYGQTSAPVLRVSMCPAAGLKQLDWLISHNHIKSIYLLSILGMEAMLWRQLSLWHSLIIPSNYCICFHSASLCNWCFGFLLCKMRKMMPRIYISQMISIKWKNIYHEVRYSYWKHNLSPFSRLPVPNVVTLV